MSKRLLLIITGGIAAYKSLELIRLLKADGWQVTTVLTAAAQHFVTPLSVAALSGQSVYTDVFSLKDETEMGHIRLSREADAILVCPASADFLAKMAHGLADDLASTALLASDKPPMVCPAMNVQMWKHPATISNLALLQQRGVRVMPPVEGAMACGEYGHGRLPEPAAVKAWLEENLRPMARPLQGYTALVTSGPTHEPIDPVRYIGNISTGTQGHAIAAALAEAGASVTLVHGKTALPCPAGVRAVPVTTADEMLTACLQTLPVDITVCAAAVADWKPAAPASNKLKKQEGGAPPVLSLVENPDILRTLAHHPVHRPRLVIGFALETGATNPEEKRQRKGCDWLLANRITDTNPAFGDAANTLTLYRAGQSPEEWAKDSKTALAKRLAIAIGEYITKKTG